MSLDSEVMLGIQTLVPYSPHTPQKSKSNVHSSICFTISPPSSLAFKPLPSHILRLHLQIFTMGDLYHSAPCHRRGPRFSVCLLYSGASGPGAGEAAA